MVIPGWIHDANGDAIQTTIATAAFENNGKITSVKIHEGVTEIGAQAFEGCTFLSSAEIPDSVTSIGGNAFNGCILLNSVTFGGDDTVIDEPNSFPEGANLRSAYQSEGTGEYLLTGNTWAKQ